MMYLKMIKCGKNKKNGQDRKESVVGMGVAGLHREVKVGLVKR